jgi:transglutaminase-like putative cysteine protease
MRKFPGRWSFLVALAAAIGCGKDAGPQQAAAAAPAVPSPADAMAAAAPPTATPPAPAVPADAVAATAPRAASAPAAAAPASDPSRLISDVWYRTLDDGQPSGWLHVRWTRSTWEGKPSIHDRTEGFSSSTRQMGGSEDRFESRSYSDLERTEDGLLLRLEARGIQAGRLSESVQTWTGKSYEWTNRVAGLEEKRTVACDAPCPVDSEAFLSKKLKAGEVVVGGSFEYKAPNFLGERLDTVSLRVDAKEKVKTPAGEYECFRVVERVVGTPGDQTWWLDASGVVRRIRSGRRETVSATEQQARNLEDGGAVYSITVGADPVMPRCTSLDRAVVDITFAQREGMELPDFPKTPFSHEVSRDGDVIRLELTAHDEAADAIALPVKDPALGKYLERTNLLCWDAPRVKAALREAAGDEKDAREIVKKLLRYVFLTLRKGSGPIPSPTAVEILEDGGGDCSEHCVLFVTLCRAAGIPARRLSGYAQVGDVWGSHSFSEVWLGRWVGCDPTTNDFGTKARYIAFGWDDDADSFPGLVSERARGRMEIRTFEFEERGRTWKAQDAGESSEREDVLAGLAFADPPEGWSAIAQGNGRARIAGPGVRADLNVVAGFGDLTADMLVRTMMRGSKKSQFAGREVARDDIAVHGHVTVQMMVPFRRRTLSMRIRVDDPKKADAALTTIAQILAPTL